MRGVVHEYDSGYMAALRSAYMVEVIPNPRSDFERGWNAYATEIESTEETGLLRYESELS